ncbi:MAG: hypothetical protein Kow0059_08900 [Candidatus Sumerlaeia bacterium]
MNDNIYSIHDVSRMTGLEESEIRFYEAVFAEFLQFSRMGSSRRAFTDDHVAILNRIRQLVQSSGYSIEEIKKELRQILRPAGRSGASGAGGAADTGSDAITWKAGLQDNNGRTQTRRPGQPARIISVTSGKGGVGKTTLAVNLAITFAQRGLKTALLDADLGLANAHILLGMKPKFNLSHVVLDRFEIEDVIVRGPLGVLVLSGGQGLREMANLSAEQRAKLLRGLGQLERSLDIMIVDTGAGISENVINFAAYADEVIVITSPNLAAITDAFSIIKILLEKDRRSKIGIVTNFVEDMYQAKNIFNRLHTAALKAFQFELGDLGHIVRDPEMDRPAQERKPIILSAPSSASARCIATIADTILNEKVFKNMEKESSFSDLMGVLRRNMAGVAV